MSKLEFDDELKELIPPLREDEYNQLKENLEREGWRDSEAIIVWDGKIVDGHHRYKLCKELGIKDFNVVEKDFGSKVEVKVWMINNQKGRRNLSDGWKWELAQVKKDLLIENGRKTQGKRTDLLSDSDKKLDKKHNTQKALAEDLGWSTGKVAKADKVWVDSDNGTKQKIKDGDKSFDAVYREIRKEEKKKERKEEIKRQREAIESGDVDLPEGKYEVIVVDPPWRYREKSSYEPSHYMGRVANPYPTMTLEEIKNIDLPVANDCVLWLWTTHEHIWYAKNILEDWGFNYKGILVWNKVKIGVGQWLRKQCEFCLLGIKGKPIWTKNDVRDIIKEPRTNHSKKPGKFYEMVENVCVGRKLDYFAREERDGWDVYGVEVE